MDQRSSAFDRLIEFQQEQITSADSKIKIFNNYKRDYEELKTLIGKMKDSIKWPHNVPIAGSQLALMPGHIIHTNEIMVLLGDNIFAVRSSKQAQDIVDRRLIGVNDMISKTQEEKRKTQDWLKATIEQKQEKEEFVEIIEYSNDIQHVKKNSNNKYT